MVLSFLGIVVGAIMIAALQPNRYEASMKILVKRDRADPVVTPAAAQAPPSSEVTEEQHNSEVELIKSKDLLQKLVLTTGLQEHAPTVPWYRAIGGKGASTKTEPSEKERRAAMALLALTKHLKADVVKKTNLIEVDYESSDPKMAVRVLNNLATLYLEKHVAVHRPPGALEFFQRQTAQYRKELADAQVRLLEFERRSGVISAPLEKEAALQKHAEFDAVLKQTEAAVAENQQRLRMLQEQAGSIPHRMVTQVRDADDATLLSGIRTNLLALEQKRAELLTKFAPSYRLVQQVDAQIAEARTALASAEKAKLHEETTDRNPTHEWAREELEKTRATLAGLQARASATALAAQSYQKHARALEEHEISQSNLLRTVKAAEDSYLLYLRKEEEARTSEALDRGRMLNVAIAEPATVPLLSSTHRARIVLFGVLLGMFVSMALALCAEYFNSTFRTPAELGAFLDIPVLAAIPQQATDISFNGTVRSLDGTHDAVNSE
jgi:uncharacterized protein involved in exopolysaccharide biosynthesis